MPPLRHLIHQGPIKLYLIKAIEAGRSGQTQSVRTFARIVLPLLFGDTLTLAVMGFDKLWHQMGWLWLVLHVATSILAVVAIAGLVVQARAKEALPPEALLAAGESVMHRSYAALFLLNLVIGFVR